MKKVIFAGLAAFLFAACSTSRGSLYRETVRTETETVTAQTEEARSEEETVKKSETGLEIVSDPEEAEIYLDNRYLGLTPLLLEDLEPGRYKLTLKKKGYYPYNGWIDFYEDYLLHEAVLEPITGTFKITTVPGNALIYLATSELESGSASEIPVGSYSLRVRAFGYEDYVARVEIEEKLMTSLRVELKAAEFSLYDVRASKKVFNPENAGLLGRTRVSFLVTSFGRGRAVVLNEQNQEVFSREFSSFKTWEQSFEWNGRDDAGLLLPDGFYKVVIEARSAPAEELFFKKEISVQIDSSLRIDYRSLWSGSAGLLYAPVPEVLPDQNIQLSTLILAHLESPGGVLSFSAPWNIAFRLGLNNNLEIDALAGLIIGHYQNESGAGSIFPFFAGASLKAVLLKPSGSFGLGSSALIRLSYQNVSTDRLANFTGIGAGLPSSLTLGPVGIVISPEMVLSYTRVYHYPQSAPEPGLFVWAYGKTGLILDLGSLIFGVSASFRTKPFQEGFGLDLPLQGGAEIHWLVPGTQLYLSLALAAEYSSPENFYLLSGLGLGLLD